MIYDNVNDKRAILEKKRTDIKDKITELNEEILRHKKKKAIISKDLSDYQAEIIYYRQILKETQQDIKEL